MCLIQEMVLDHQYPNASSSRQVEEVEDDGTPLPRKKSKQSMRPLTEYEENLYELNEKRIDQAIRHAEEMHELKMEQEVQYHAERMRLLREQLK